MRIDATHSGDVNSSWYHRSDQPCGGNRNVWVDEKLIGIILAHTALAVPFVVIAVTARLQGMDGRLPGVAGVLGASPVNAFRRVTLPLVMPGILSGAVLAFVTSLDEVVIALFMQAPGAVTLPVQMFNSVTVQIDPTISAASSLMVVLVSVPILFAQIAGARRGRRGKR